VRLVHVAPSNLDVLFDQAVPGLHFTDHVVGNGPGVRKHACEMGLEGVVSKRLEQPLHAWQSQPVADFKCLNREEFVVVGWTDPEETGSVSSSLLADVRFRTERDPAAPNCPSQR